jgi:hypothetical protein
MATTGGTGGGSSGCSTTTKATFSGYFGTDTPSIQSGNSVSYLLPAWSTAGKYMQIQGVNNGGDGYTNPNWTVQFSISPCAGDFNPTQSACTSLGTPLNGALQILAYSGATPQAGNCTIVAGQQAYLNVRFIDTNLTTTQCASGRYCSLIINFHSNSPN